MTPTQPDPKLPLYNGPWLGVNDPRIYSGPAIRVPQHPDYDPDEYGDTMSAEELHERYEQPGSGNEGNTGFIWS